MVEYINKGPDGTNAGAGSGAGADAGVQPEPSCMHAFVDHATVFKILDFMQGRSRTVLHFMQDVSKRISYMATRTNIGVAMLLALSVMIAASFRIQHHIKINREALLQSNVSSDSSSEALIQSNHVVQILSAGPNMTLNKLGVECDSVDEFHYMVFGEPGNSWILAVPHMLLLTAIFSSQALGKVHRYTGFLGWRHYRRSSAYNSLSSIMEDTHTPPSSPACNSLPPVFSIHPDYQVWTALRHTE